MQTLLTAGFQDEDYAESHSTGIFAIFAGVAVIALAQILHIALVGIEPARARLPRSIVPISPTERTKMTQKLLNELQHSSLAELVDIWPSSPRLPR